MKLSVRSFKGKQSKQTFFEQIADVKINTPLSMMGKSVEERSRQLTEKEFAENLFLNNTASLKK